MRTPAAPRAIAGVCRVLLRCYPATFRARHGRVFIETARDRWQREHARSSAVMATASTVAILVTDTLRAAPAAWRAQRRPHASTRRRLPWWRGWLSDLKYVFRGLGRTPVYSAIAVLSLAIGIGATTSIYGAIRFALLDPLPVDRPEELRRIYWSGPEDMRSVSQMYSGGGTDPTTGRNLRSNYSYPTATVLQALDIPSMQVFAFNFMPPVAVVAGDAPAASAGGLMVSSSYFSVLRPGLHAGRPILPSDDEPGAPPVVVISHGFWMRALGAEPAILGSTVSLNGAAFQVVGITAPGFDGISTGGSSTPITDITVPLSAQPLVWATAGALRSTNDRLWIRLMARIETSESEVAATSALTHTLAQSLVETGLIPDDQRADVLLRLLPGDRGVDGVSSRARQPLTVLGGVVAVVLLIACVNLAGLMLARGVARQRELAVRRALGAARWHLVRQLLTEGLVLAVAGGTLGLLATAWASPVVGWMIATGFGADAGELPLDWPTLRLAMAVSVVAALLCSLLPALRLTGRDTLHLRHQVAGRQAPRLTTGRVLLAAQIAISIPLVVGAGLLLRSLGNLGAIDPGFEPEGLVIARLEPGLGASFDTDRLPQLSERLIERLRSVPGVTAATMVENALISGWMSNNNALINGEERMIYMNGVGPDFFATMGIPLIAGRPIGPQDRAGAPAVVVINETAAREYFGEALPLGHRFRYGRTDAEVVGIAADSRYASLRSEVPPTLFDSYQQRAGGWVSHFVLRVPAAGSGLERAVRAAVAEVSPDVAVGTFQTQQTQINATIGRERLIARLLSTFGLFALLLACIGLYGVTAYSVSRRTSEIGIRLALGADRGHVVWMILRQVFGLAAAGLIVGIPLAWLAAPLLESLLYGLGPHDLSTIAAAAAVMLGVALIAGLIPARRAARLPALQALREGQ